MPVAIMVQGTASGVGKSWLATGLCRVFARRGLRVAPFKAWNMSNNAAPAQDLEGDWGEIGRAQAVQAAACGRAPHVDMNPILVKPMGQGASQVIVAGRPMSGYTQARGLEAIHAAWARIAASADVVILEGAGSPAEINLRAYDIVNMAMAHHADARVLLVGDIDRGGVFASLYGTVQLLPPEDRARLMGLVINRFRGDVARLRPGLAPLEELCGVPVRGILPWRSDLRVDEEDAVEITSTTGLIDVCVLHLPTVSNFTDLGALAQTPGVGVRWAARPTEVGNPDLLVLPGSKDTLYDLRWLGEVGLSRSVRAAAARGIPILGLCGGYQILGEKVEADGVVMPGLGLLPVQTVMAADKTVRPVQGQTCAGWLLPAGLPVAGYEIHHGLTPAGATPLLHTDGPDGAIAGLVAGTYVHGFLDTDAVRDAIVAALYARKGLEPASPLRPRASVYDALADVVEENLDLSA